MAPSKEVVVKELAGRSVRITSPTKVFFTKRGETKLDLVEYYEAGHMMYLHPPSLVKFNDDLVRFIRAACGG